MSSDKVKKYLLMIVAIFLGISFFSKFISNLLGRKDYQDDSSVVQEILAEEQPTTEETEIPSIEPPTTTEEPTESQTVEETAKAVVYDELQEIFLGLSLNTVWDDLNDLKEGKNVVLGSGKKEESTLSCRFAYDDDTAIGTRRGSGDYIDFVFSLADGGIMSATYKNRKGYVLLYNYGRVFDFEESEPNNSSSGYYCLRGQNELSCRHCDSPEFALSLVK